MSCSSNTNGFLKQEGQGFLSAKSFWFMYIVDAPFIRISTLSLSNSFWSTTWLMRPSKDSHCKFAFSKLHIFDLSLSLSLPSTSLLVCFIFICNALQPIRHYHKLWQTCHECLFIEIILLYFK